MTLSTPSCGSAEEIRLGLVTTYPPTRCGVGRFSACLVEALSPEVAVDVVRLVNDGPGPAGVDQPVLEIVPDLPISIRAAARRLNLCDVVMFQHEYGIYGRSDGEAIVELVERVEPPKLAVLHTVRDRPTSRQREIITQVALDCHLVALSHSAGRLLVSQYGLDASRLTVIPHGAMWSPRPINSPPRRKLITWGLLGPGKGIERAIEALALLKNLQPPPVYRIVGRTHPMVVRAEGYAYRRELERLVDSLDLRDLVQFVDRYVDDDELHEMVTASDVVVIPYDNEEQVSSGVLTEAVAAGRPVVATRFPHAVELRGGGSGITVEHDVAAMAEALRTLLGDEIAYRRCAETAAQQAASLAWSNCAVQYGSLINRIRSEAAIAEPIDA